MCCVAGAKGVGAGGSEAGVDAEMSTVFELNGWGGRGWPGRGAAMGSSGVI